VNERGRVGKDENNAAPAVICWQLCMETIPPSLLTTLVEFINGVMKLAAKVVLHTLRDGP
jgi:hypothetical protein